jgi:EAL domain-containing protein (putative c-di-GMP-specific phosphodiesterase class I)
VLEITEGVLLEATDRINAILDAIRAMGFKTALDDSGPAMRAWPIYAISGSTRSR